MSKFTPEIVPLYEEGIKIQRFKDEYLIPNLRTGEFHLFSNEMLFWTNKDTLGPDSHYHMNKDSAESLAGKVIIVGQLTYADLSIAIAVRATSTIISIKRNQGDLLLYVPRYITTGRGERTFAGYKR